MKNKRVVLIAAVLIIAAGATGFAVAARNDNKSSNSQVQTAVQNNDDISFTQGMIPHHKQAVEMAKLAATRANDPKVKDLAKRIEGAQDPEIIVLRGFLKVYGVTEVTTNTHSMQHSSNGNMDMGNSMGMAGDTDMQKLMAATGAEFDKQFVALMTAHHEGAVMMAKAELTDGKYQPAKDLAQQIIDAQTKEITEMKGFNL